MNINELRNLKKKIVADLELLSEEYGSDWGTETMDKIRDIANELDAIILDNRK